MKFKKLMAASLAASMALLAGCTSEPANKDVNDNASTENQGSEQSGDDSEVKKPFEVTMLYCDNANYPVKDDWMVFKEIEEKTGAKIKVQAVPESDYVAKQQIVFNSGDIPDIVTKTFPKAEDALAGLLLPISKYEDQMPNFKKFIDDNGLRQELENTKMSDGNYYGLPVKAHTSKIQDQQWLIRKDIFDKNNIPVPKTLEDVYEAGKKLKEIYPDSTPITNRFGADNIMSGISGGFGTIAGWTIGDGMYYDADKDEWEFAPTTENWKKMLEYTNKLYKDGVLDPEFGTLDSGIYEQRIITGKTFIMLDWVGNIKNRYAIEGPKNDPDFDIQPIYPPTGPDGDYALNWKASWGQSWVLPASLEEDPDHLKEVLSFIDWCYTDEAETLLTFGKEGETYKTVDGINQFIDSEIKYDALYGLNNNCLNVREDKGFLYGTLTPEQVEVFDKIAADGCVPTPNPASPLTPDQIEETKVYSSSLLDYTKTMMESFIFGKESLDNWDKFVATCKEKGSDKLVEAYNKSWKEQKSK